ncbi:MAG: carboxypeptidase-like regulatory domain-containing protein [Chitinophagales bacterium]|nr:carboxypeptidase-like regulatory domain-containing protein [Chitinophagales bacterium]MDW8427345.1 carboxypeptidase-like regulatory domain-containing protein [Chitinophagales bacterium]
MIIVCLIWQHGFAQTGVLTGLVTDGSTGEPLIGATVAVVNTTLGAVTDLDGVYLINGIPAGEVSLKVSYVGYEAKELTGVSIQAGEVTTLNVTLNVSASTTLQEVVVTADMKRENIQSLLIARKNSAVISDAIGADMIRRSPDKNTSEVLRRVSGVSVQENKFVVVRGMNDRYNAAMLNGALLPSSEPDRKTFAFDIFPSSIVDNITVIKSPTPELPGDFAGGLVQIHTKEIPDKNFISVKAGASYNSLATFQPYYTYTGGKLDWLGIDDGTRALPKNFPSQQEFLTMSAADRIAAAKTLPNHWGYFLNPSAPSNPSVQIAGGLRTRSASSPFGAILGITYNDSRRFYPYERYDYYGLKDALSDTIYNYRDSSFQRNVLTSALANFAFKVNANNKFYFNNVFSVNSTDLTILRSGFSFNALNYIRANSFYFVSNQIYSGQLSGEHYLPGLKFRIQWRGYYTSLLRDEPGYRRNLYASETLEGPYYCKLSPSPSTNIGAGLIYHGRTTDDTYGGKLDLSKAFRLFMRPQTIRFGGEYFYNQRFRNVRVFSNYIASASTFNYNLYYAAQDTIFDPSHYDLVTGFALGEDLTTTNNYDGLIDNRTAYVMLDNKLLDALRLVWGIRGESYHYKLNTFDAAFNPFTADTTYVNLLPSINLILSPLASANLRLIYYQAVARPSYREMANAPFYDFLQNITFYGNVNLVQTHVTSYEMRWEQFFSNAQFYSAGFFFKEFKAPIEQNLLVTNTDTRAVYYINIPRATNLGVELEARKNLEFLGAGWDNFFAYANVAYIRSKVFVRGASSDTSEFRPMEGQSPLVVNASLQYSDNRSGLNATLMFNYISPRLFLVGNVQDPSVMQQLHPTLDFKISKTIARRWQLEVSFADILNGDDFLYEDKNRNGRFDPKPTGAYEASDRMILRQSFGFNAGVALSLQF